MERSSEPALGLAQRRRRSQDRVLHDSRESGQRRGAGDARTGREAIRERHVVLRLAGHCRRRAGALAASAWLMQAVVAALNVGSGGRVVVVVATVVVVVFGGLALAGTHVSTAASQPTSRCSSTTSGAT